MTRYRLRHTEDAPPSPCIEHMHGNVLLREFPVHVARVREYKKRHGGVLIGRAA